MNQQTPGQPPTKKSLSLGKILLIVGGVGFASCTALVIVGAIAGSKAVTKVTEAEAPSAAPQGPALAVAAADLVSAYRANEVSADTKFKGKTLAVSGTVSSISKDMLDSVVITLAAEGSFSGVNAYGIPPDYAGKLEKGSAVTFKCQGDGMIVGTPILRQCKPE